MKKLLIVILPAFFWATSDVLARISSSKINDILGAMILSLGAFLILFLGMFALVPDLTKEVSNISLKYFLIALVAGVANATGLFFFFRFLQQGGNFTQGMPMILTSIVIFTTIYGLIFFKDPLTLKTIIGLALGIGAIYFLSS